MTDEPQTPNISIGFFILPMALANFSTEEDGRNTILESYIYFCNDVLAETCRKLSQLATQVAENQEVELKHLTREEMRSMVKCCVESGTDTDNPGSYGIMTDEGRIITDEQTVEHILKGGSIS